MMRVLVVVKPELVRAALKWYDDTAAVVLDSERRAKGGRL